MAAINALDLCQTLLRIPSETPDDNGCQPLLNKRLEALGFEIEQWTVEGVVNSLAVLNNGEGPSLLLAGHTDVVPAGNHDNWQPGPYSGDIVNGEIVGRGAADMKGGLACMIAATEAWLTTLKSAFKGTLLFAFTSDEEGEAEFGSKEIAARMAERDLIPDFCIMGEPSSRNHIGDAIFVGRRGALSFKLAIKGKAAHVAWPQNGNNAIHNMGRIINALTQLAWDEGSTDFPGTSLQITHIDSGRFTDNIIPDSCAIHFNIRYSHNYSQQELIDKITQTVAPLDESAELTFDRPCIPYFTAAGRQSEHDLIANTEMAIHQLTGSFPLLSTAGGTSDGRFFTFEEYRPEKPTQVIELGLKNKTIHQINERVGVDDIYQLTGIYQQILRNIFGH